MSNTARRQFLSSLPNEILTEVINDLGPTDTWSLAQTSKGFYHVSQPAMQKHIKNKYSTVSLHIYSIPLFFLDRILREPRIASYVIRLQFARGKYAEDECYFAPGEFDKRQEKLTATIATQSTQLATLATDCPWFSRTRRRKWRDALLQPRDHSYHLAILLTKLPNLQSVTMIGMYDDYEPILKLVSAVTKANRNPSSAGFEHALSKMKTVTVSDWDNVGGRDLVVLASFLALPSIRSLHGRECLDRRGIMPSALVDPSHPSMHHSHMEEIKILHSDIDLTPWGLLLKPMKNLRSFTYQHVGGGGGDMFGNHPPGCIMPALHRYARHSLTRLDITCGNEASVGMDFAWDLKAFQNLRLLGVNHTAFLMHARLIDTLPASLEWLGLLSDNLFNPIDLFAGLVEERHKLPKLETIRLEGEIDLPRDLFVGCRDVGIKIYGSDLEII
ncbi:MAG: hypothetical protein L6R35_005320 [Caloplaca aegaea]|nr:MAG: hypothetical protein L6R35_005320 [Caloplaca aegaea]